MVTGFARGLFRDVENVKVVLAGYCWFLMILSPFQNVGDYLVWLCD